MHAYIYIYIHIIFPTPNKNPPYKMTSLPPSKLIVPPSKLTVTIFASEGGFLMRGVVIVPPSKLIVTRQCPLQGGFLIRGGSY